MPLSGRIVCDCRTVVRRGWARFLLHAGDSDDESGDSTEAGECCAGATAVGGLKALFLLVSCNLAGSCACDFKARALCRLGSNEQGSSLIAIGLDL